MTRDKFEGLLPWVFMAIPISIAIGAIKLSELLFKSDDAQFISTVALWILGGVMAMKIIKRFKLDEI